MNIILEIIKLRKNWMIRNLFNLRSTTKTISPSNILHENFALLVLFKTFFFIIKKIKMIR